MSLFKKKKKENRPSKEIQQEYQSACAAVGDREFQISILRSQVEHLYKRMHELGAEMNGAIQRENAEKAKEAASKEASNG